MSASQLRRRCIAFLAMLAVAFGALAPTLAQAVVAAGSQDAFMEVCTSTGMLMTVQTGADTQPYGRGDALADMQKPCTWCGMHGALAPPAALPLLSLLPGAQDMPAAFYRDGPRPAIWLGAHTRAPPLRG